MLLRKEFIPWIKVGSGVNGVRLLTSKPTVVIGDESQLIPRPDRTSRLLQLVPHGVFAILFGVTYKRWFLPFQDHGREMMTPERLAHGEVLYRDIGWSYGPLSPHLDAAALRLFGEHLDILIALRTVIALLGIVALQRLASRLVRDPLAAAALTSFIVTATFFGFGSPYPFPYSAAALEGSVGTWWALELALGSKGWRRSLAAALVAGIAATTKLELVPSALSGMWLVLLWRRPRREAVACGLAALSIAVAGFGLPVLFLGVETLRRHGFLLAFETPVSWRHFYSSVIFGGPDFKAYLSSGVIQTLVPSVPFLLLSLGLLVVAGPFPLGAGVAAALLGVIAWWLPNNDELHILIPLAIALAVWEFSVLLRARAFRDPDSTSCARVCVAVSMLFVVWRQPFFIRIPDYSAFSSPLALLSCLSWLGTRTTPRLARAIPLLLLSLGAAQSADRWIESRRFAMRWVSLPRASLFLPVESAILLEGAYRLLDRFSRPGDFVCMFPEPGFLTFATRRRSPFIDEQFHPGIQNARAEEEMIQRLSERPIAVALLTNRVMDEYGTTEYRHGLLDLFFVEFDRRMKLAGVVGDPRRAIPGMGQATAALVYLPREPSVPATGGP